MSPIVAIFAAVYLGMILGGVPGLRLDRTGVALLGAIAVVVAGAFPGGDPWVAVDMPTLYLLFGLMVVSAQFRLAGFYTEIVRRMVAVEVSPPALLALVLVVAGGLSALLTNDVVCLAMTPILVLGCSRRRLDPLPFLLGLACASNVGSAATLVGNPQNILIGQRLGLSFAGFLLDAGVPAVLGLAATWALLVLRFRGHWEKETPPPQAVLPRFNRWQSAKGLAVIGVIVVLFLARRDLPHAAVALVGAGVLLLSRRMATREMLALVDWQLLVLFVGLFIVNHALAGTGAVDRGLAGLGAAGVDVRHPGWLFATSAVLSNIVSNVPATMLLLPAASHPLAGPILALSSTLAGNLIIVGSIANIIVVGSAAALGVRIGFRDHARSGVPVTLATLAIAAGWLWLRSG